MGQYATIGLALLPVIYQVITEVLSQQAKYPAGTGKGSTKKKNVMESVVNLLGVISVSKLFGASDTPLVSFADGLTEFMVKFFKDSGIFRTTVDIDTTPTGGGE